ncbi:MAG: hypothetical protein AAGI92_02435 [Pseudomonadota bacterium]
MPAWPLYVSAALSTLWFSAHTFVGGREIINPLMASKDLNKTTRAVLRMVWHMVTLTLLLMAILFALAAITASREFTIAATALSAVICIAGIVTIPLSGTSFKEAPQGWLFLPSTLLGLYVLL